MMDYFAKLQQINETAPYLEHFSRDASKYVSFWQQGGERVCVPLPMLSTEKNHSIYFIRLTCREHPYGQKYHRQPHEPPKSTKRAATREKKHETRRITKKTGKKVKKTHSAYLILINYKADNCTEICIS